MKYVVRYETGPDLDMEKAMATFPAHQAHYGTFVDAGTLLLIGPMADPTEGALAIFTTRDAAEAFVAGDPFVGEGLVSRSSITEWNEVLLPPL